MCRFYESNHFSCLQLPKPHVLSPAGRNKQFALIGTGNATDVVVVPGKTLYFQTCFQIPAYDDAVFVRRNKVSSITNEFKFLIFWPLTASVQTDSGCTSDFLIVFRCLPGFLSLIWALLPAEAAYRAAGLKIICSTKDEAAAVVIHWQTFSRGLPFACLQSRPTCRATFRGRSDSTQTCNTDTGKPVKYRLFRPGAPPR